MLSVLVLMPWMIASAAVQPPACGPGWEQVKQEQGIRLCTTSVPGTPLLKVKTAMDVAAKINRVEAILQAVQQRKDWVPYLAESRVLTPWEDHRRLEYSLFSAPWPASDRDFVYSVERYRRSDGARVYHMYSVTSALMPVNPGRVRAELMESTYILSVPAPGMTRVELVFHADPGGWLPDWIINIIQKVLPYRMLYNLRQRALAP